MRELARLGAIIDQLFVKHRRRAGLSKRLVFVVGNGIDNVNNIINDDGLRQKAGGRFKKPRAFEAYKWRHFEYARYYTSNTLPSFAHCCIFKFVEAGLCRDVITTNYDMFFDTIWRRFGTVGIRQNPVLDPGEYDWEDYYAVKSETVSNPSYWKIHGSLSHVCFQPRDPDGQPHLHRLPRFAISGNDDRLARSFKIPTQAPCLEFESKRFHATTFTHPSQLKPSFSPFIDWTYANDRARFAREISAAKAVLRKPRNIAALILIGFSGYFNEADGSDPWNEELVPDVLRLHEDGFPNIFMAVHNQQYARIAKAPYGLMRRLSDVKRCWTYDLAGNFMREVVTTHSQKFPSDYAHYEWERWKNTFMPKGEMSHV